MFTYKQSEGVTCRDITVNVPAIKPNIDTITGPLDEALPKEQYDMEHCHSKPSLIEDQVM